MSNDMSDDMLTWKLQAAEKLRPSSAAAGQAFFVTNDEPVPFWGFMGDLLEPLGYGRPHIKLPWQLLLVVALILEWLVYPLLQRLTTIKKSDFTSSRIRITSSNREISCQRAKDVLGYKPAVSLAEGLKRTTAYFEPLKNRGV